MYVTRVTGLPAVARTQDACAQFIHKALADIYISRLLSNIDEDYGGRRCQLLGTMCGLFAVYRCKLAKGPMRRRGAARTPDAPRRTTSRACVLML